MALKTLITTQKEFSADEAITAEKLNKLGTPTVAIEGMVGTADIEDENVTNAKLKQETTTDGNANNDGAVTDSVVASNAAISLSKLESVSDGLFVAGNSDDKAKAQEVLGDITFSRARNISFADDSSNTETDVDDLIGKQILIGEDVGELVKVDGSTLHFKPVSSTRGYAVEVDESIKFQPTSITFDNQQQGVNISVGDTVKGSTSGATAVVNAKDEFTLTLINVSGFFQADENLKNASADGEPIFGDMNTGVPVQVATVSTDGSSLSDILVSSVADDAQSASIVPVEDIKPSGTSGHVLTSNGPSDAPSYQAVDITPAVILKLTDCSGSGATTSGVKSFNITGESSDVLTASAGEFDDLATVTKVIFVGSETPNPLNAYQFYYARKVNGNQIKVYQTQSGADDEEEEQLVTSYASFSNFHMCQPLATCSGSVGGTLYADASSNGTTSKSYVLVFDSQVQNYFIHGNAFVRNNEWGQSEDSLEKSAWNRADFKQISSGSSYCKFQFVYPHGWNNYYHWKHITLIVHSY